MMTDDEKFITKRLVEFIETHPTYEISEIVPIDEFIEAIKSKNSDCKLISWYILDRLNSNTDLKFLDDKEQTLEGLAEFISESRKFTLLNNIKNRSKAEEVISSLSKNEPLDPFGDTTPTARNSMTILIHGTWARKKQWWRQGGDFWRYLRGDPKQGVRGIAPDLYDYIHPFSWSGDNKHNSRVVAADELIKWCKINSTNSLQIIAHSHGGNVAMMAAQKGLRIDRLILLGTPIRLEYLPPNENQPIIKNVFSTSDNVQTPLGTTPNRRGEGRTLAENANVSNHIAMSNGHGNRPDHSDLHEEDTWRGSDLYKIVR